MFVICIGNQMTPWVETIKGPLPRVIGFHFCSYCRKTLDFSHYTDGFVAHYKKCGCHNKPQHAVMVMVPEDKKSK